MQYRRISADCHLDLPWMPPDLFTSNASPGMKERMPYVADGPDGPHWTCKNGTSFGLMNGVWYKVKQGMRGLVVRDRKGGAVVFMLSEPSTRYYRVMTRAEWMPVLVDEVI